MSSHTSRNLGKWKCCVGMCEAPNHTGRLSCCMPSGHIRDVGDSQPLQDLMGPGSQILPAEQV